MHRAKKILCTCAAATEANPLSLQTEEKHTIYLSNDNHTFFQPFKPTEGLLSTPPQNTPLHPPPSQLSSDDASYIRNQQIILLLSVVPPTTPTARHILPSGDGSNQPAQRLSLITRSRTTTHTYMQVAMHACETSATPSLQPRPPRLHTNIYSVHH